MSTDNDNPYGELLNKLLEEPTRRERRKPFANMSRTSRRERQRGEIAPRSKAIINHCRACMGWDAGDYPSLRHAVEACEAHGCWLWPYRIGGVTNDETNR